MTLSGENECSNNSLELFGAEMSRNVLSHATLLDVSLLVEEVTPDLICQEFDLIAHCSAAHVLKETDVFLILHATFLTSEPVLHSSITPLHRLQLKIK